MRIPLSRLLAVLAAAILCLSPLALATAVHADENPDVGYARNGGIPYEEPDLGEARHGGIPYEEPDLGQLRNEVVVPEPAPAPSTPVDTGVDTGTVVLAGVTAAVILGIGVTGIVFYRRRHDHHLAHPA